MCLKSEVFAREKVKAFLFFFFTAKTGRIVRRFVLSSLKSSLLCTG